MSPRVALSLDEMGAKLASVFNEADLHDAKETLRDCLMATRTVRAGHDATGRIIYEEQTDYPIRLAASVKIIEWVVGKPVSRSVHADISEKAGDVVATTKDQLLGLLLDDPNAAADIVLKLQKAAQEHKNAIAVDVTASEPLPKPPGSTA